MHIPQLFIHLSIDRLLFLPAGFWDTVNIAPVSMCIQVFVCGLDLVCFGSGCFSSLCSWGEPEPWSSCLPLPRSAGAPGVRHHSALSSFEYAPGLRLLGHMDSFLRTARLFSLMAKVCQFLLAVLSLSHQCLLSYFVRDENSLCCLGLIESQESSNTSASAFLVARFTGMCHCDSPILGFVLILIN